MNNVITNIVGMFQKIITGLKNYYVSEVEKWYQNRIKNPGRMMVIDGTKSLFIILLAVLFMVNRRSK
jgi:hypothetical protein